MQRPLYVFLLTIFALIGITGCSFSDPTSDPKALVSEMYDALSDGDMDRYMETIHPSNHSQPNPLGILFALQLDVGVGGGFSLGLSNLFDMNFRDVKVSIITEEDTYALVQAEGNIRIPILLYETRFCEQLDLRYESKRWFIDLAAPEKQVRMQQLLEMKQLEITGSVREMPYHSAPEDQQRELIKLIGSTLNSYMDLCVPFYS